MLEAIQSMSTAELIFLLLFLIVVLWLLKLILMARFWIILLAIFLLTLI